MLRKEKPFQIALKVLWLDLRTDRLCCRLQLYQKHAHMS